MTTLTRYDVTEGMATITLDNPAKRNALSRALLGELRALLGKAVADDAVRVIVLTHTGSVFCSGMDLSEAKGAKGKDMGVNAFPEILQMIWDSPKPVVARIAGPARAGGIGLVAAADIAVCTTSATFAFSEVRLGLVPAVISVMSLPRMNARAAHELFLTGEVFDGARAKEIGLVNAAVPDDQLNETTISYVSALAQGGPIALRSTKELLRRPAWTDAAAALAEMQKLSAGFFASEEGQEGISAFAQKRPAAWAPGAREPDAKS